MRELALVSAGKAVILQHDQTALSVNYGKAKRIEVHFRQVLWVEATQDIVQVCFLAERKRKGLLYSLERIEGTVKDAAAAGEWAEALMNAAYEGAKPSRRLKVLVNPHGGVGNAVPIFIKLVEPILRSARCSIDVTHTTRKGHAYEIAKDLSLDYDALVIVSGDGLIHEVVNGLADHKQPTEALSISIVPIPTGSGNGLSVNLLGIKYGFDVSVATLNAIKGQPMKADVCSVTQNGRRSYSFLSQATGLLAELDTETENLRWMGDTRFIVGFFKGVAQFKPCLVQLSIKLAEKDKSVMAAQAQARRKPGGNDTNNPTITATPAAQEDESPLKPSEEDGPGWYTFNRPVFYLLGGKVPYVGRDYMAFPVSSHDDGLVDLVAQELTTRGDILGAFPGAEQGRQFWRSSHHYFKAYAYRVKPLSGNGHFAVDGELFPFEEVLVEVHPKMVSFLSTFGSYVVDFTATTPRKDKGKSKA